MNTSPGFRVVHSMCGPQLRGPMQSVSMRLAVCVCAEYFFGVPIRVPSVAGIVGFDNII